MCYINFKLNTIGAILISLCLVETVVGTIDPEIKSQIDEFIEKVYLPSSGITGLGLTIVKNDGEVLYTTGYGLADQSQGTPNGNETQFLIGSITKSITSTIAVKVLSEKYPDLGEAVLDTPIRTLIPFVNFTLNDRFRSEHGTFRDLLSHRMCFMSDDIQMAAEPFNSTAEIVYRQRYSEEICGIRTQFQYNNQMYVFAGELIAILANTTYENLVQQLLTEIGMSNSSLGKKSDDYSNMPYRAKPYYVMDNVSHPMNTELLKRLVDSNAAGGLWSTPNDMAKYLRFHLNFGNIDGHQIVPKSTMKWLRTPSIAAPVNFIAEKLSYFSYCLGLMLASYDGWEYLQHSGSYASYQSLLSLFQNQKLGIFTSGNYAPVRVDPLVLHAFIFETLQGSQNAHAKISKLMDKMKGRQAEEKQRKSEFAQEFFQGKRGIPKCKDTFEDIVGNRHGLGY